MALPTEDRYLQSKSEFEDKIAGLLAGNVSERLVFGDTTTGSSNDIEKATNLARRMVTEFGMSDRLGPLSFGKHDELVFLGREIGEQRNYSDEIAKQIDEEVRAIIDRAGVPAVVQGMGSMLQIYFTTLPEIRTYRDIDRTDQALYSRFAHEMIRRGVFVHPDGLEHVFISAAHTEEEVATILDAADASLRALSS